MNLVAPLDRGNQLYEVPKEELAWWSNQLYKWNGRSLVLRNPNLHLVGFIPHWLGSIVRRDTDRRPLFPRGEGLPHKLPGDSWSNTGGENLIR